RREEDAGVEHLLADAVDRGADLAGIGGGVLGAIMVAAGAGKISTAVDGIAVLREGSEIVLFLYGIALAGGSGGPAAMVAGGALGLALGAAAGTAIYLGLISIPLRHLFAVTSWLVL